MFHTLFYYNCGKPVFRSTSGVSVMGVIKSGSYSIDTFQKNWGKAIYLFQSQWAFYHADMKSGGDSLFQQYWLRSFFFNTFLWTDRDKVEIY